MKVRSSLRNVVIGLLFCVAAVPVFAQAQNSQAQLPQALQLQAVQGKSGVYQDSFGHTYTVNPESGGSLCDPNGCMVQVCSGGSCTYYYCTQTKCQRIVPPNAIKQPS